MEKNATKINRKPHTRSVPTQSINSKGKHRFIEVERELDKNGIQKTIFVYLRKSTKKNTQEESIPTQNRRVLKYLKNLGINEDDVKIFTDDGISGYGDIYTEDGRVMTRPRDGFTKMMSAINASKEPCSIYTYSVSRLGRNLSEGMLIIEKLGIGYKQIQKIKEIHICGIDKQVWTKDTKKTHIQDCFNKVEADSELKSDYMYENIEENLEKSIYPPMLPTPWGLVATSEGLEETDEMKIIRHAMQMRINGKGLEAIRQYLSDNAIAYENERSITGSLFQNTLYIGTYIPKKGKLKGNVYSDLIFTSGKPVITEQFFNELQGKIGKKTGGYGKKQDENDMIAQLLRFEDDLKKRFDRYEGKGNTWQYKGTGKNGVYNKSELKIVSQFIHEVIPRIVRIYIGVLEHQKDEVFNEMSDKVDEIEKNMFIVDINSDESIEKIKQIEQTSRYKEIKNESLKISLKLKLLGSGEDISIVDSMDRKDIVAMLFAPHKKLLDESDRYLYESTKEYKALQKASMILDKEYEKILGVFSDEWVELGDSENQKIHEAEQKAKEYIRNAFDKSKVLNKDKNAQQKLEERMSVLSKKKSSAEKEIIDTPLDYAKRGFHGSTSDARIEELKNEIILYETEIQKLGLSLGKEDFLDKLPSVLIKIFELSGKVLKSQEISELRDDFYQLLEITTFELSITTKKELKIKLSNGIETLENAFFLNGPLDKNRTCV